VTEAEDESSAGLEVIQPRKSERETSTKRTSGKYKNGPLTLREDAG